MGAQHSDGHDSLHDLLAEKMDEIQGLHHDLLRHFLDRCSAMDNKWRTEIEQLSAVFASHDADARLEEIAQKAAREVGGGANNVSQTVLEDLMARFGGELESQRRTMEQQFRSSFRSMEEQLQAQRQGDGGQGDAGAIREEIGKACADLALEDAEGRRWFFRSLREFLGQVARRMKELQGSVELERHLRESSLRSVELQNAAAEGSEPRESEDAAQESGRKSTRGEPVEQESKLIYRAESQSKVNEIRQRYENGFADSDSKAREEVPLPKATTEEVALGRTLDGPSPARPRPAASRYLQVPAAKTATPASARDGLSQSASTPALRGNSAISQRPSNANSPLPSPARTPQQQTRTLSPQQKDRPVRSSPVQSSRGGQQGPASTRARPGS